MLDGNDGMSKNDDGKPAGGAATAAAAPPAAAGGAARLNRLPSQYWTLKFLISPATTTLKFECLIPGRLKFVPRATPIPHHSSWPRRILA